MVRQLCATSEQATEPNMLVVGCGHPAAVSFVIRYVFAVPCTFVVVRLLRLTHAA